MASCRFAEQSYIARTLVRHSLSAVDGDGTRLVSGYLQVAETSSPAVGAPISC
jgi:hypothetical protein